MRPSKQTTKRRALVHTGQGGKEEEEDTGPAFEPAIDDWLATSTVGVVGPFGTHDRSPALQELDRRVAHLADTRRSGASEADTIDATVAVAQELREYRKEKGSGRGVRNKAIKKLETALDGVMAERWGPREDAMRHQQSLPHLPPGRIWLHGTDALAEILTSGKVWGGTASLKRLGSGEEERANVKESKQDQHFFMARTGDDGVAEGKGGNAYIRGRQGADAKLEADTPMRSWEPAGRPLLGVIEFPYDPAEDDTSDGIKRVDTEPPDDNGLSTLPLAKLKPVAIRVCSEADAVRVLEFVRANGGRANVPLEIRVLAAPTPVRDRELLTGDAARMDEARAPLRDGGDYQRLMIEPAARWKTYKTSDCLAALDLLAAAHP